MPINNLQSLISMEDPVADYLQLTESNRQEEDDYIMIDDFNKISNAAQDVVWELFFGSNCSVFGDSDERAKETNGTNVQIIGTHFVKAAKLLKELRFDVCSIWPMCYNEWIFKVRYELIRRRMYDLWRFLVKIGLGPCWVQDPDITALIEEIETNRS